MDSMECLLIASDGDTDNLDIKMKNGKYHYDNDGDNTRKFCGRPSEFKISKS